MTAQYFDDYNTFIKNSAWYYRLSRYFFEKQLFGQRSLDMLPPENEVKYFVEKQNKLAAFKQKNGRFIQWLVGLDLLLDKITTLKNRAIENQIALQQKEKIKTELLALEESKIKTNIQQRSSCIEEHITQQRRFIQEMPGKNSDSYQCMPFLFERFGKKNEITAAPHCSGGKPMTYSNLIAEKNETLKVITKTRHRMIEKRSSVSPYSFDFDPGEKESNIIDGCYGVLNHVDTELEKLRAEAACVEVETDLRLHVSYPFK